jgi:hypothetical protein
LVNPDGVEYSKLGKQMFTMKNGAIVSGGDLAQSEIWLITISELLCGCPKISCTVLYEIITVMLVYQKLCARWVPKVLMGISKHRKCFGFDFLRVIPQRW